ncbi:MAG: alanine--tRNA ligase, partial [Rhodobacteraceae bacterium]|nr:alanine--tRNA ligase [Paracoccaceae bacterium]
MTSLNDIRSTFIRYFADRGHETVSSGPLVPHNDPTLMFTNSGMVQFKSLFTGKETRDYQRAVTSQKCVRAGGKHNDLENVGHTTRHHTFFEMLGNFSFGDYFKEDAIAFCWDLITREFSVPADRLLATVYAEDDEAHALWKKIAGFGDDRIIRIPTADNFWSMGPVGPCGPCTELFYDYGETIPGGPPGSPDEDGDRFVEIWNLVFMQYEQRDDGTRTDLPSPCIDTGMGLERIGALLQGTNDNYHTDLFRALINASAEITGTEPDGDNTIHHRVIADHLRSTSFLIAEGITPASDGRGYVLRRILRRAIRHVNRLGISEPAIYRLVPVLVRFMGDAFPELQRAEEMISTTIMGEEKRFQSTLGRGLRLLADATQSLESGDSLSGDVAFKLYDTYGFPLDLTQDALRDRAIAVDISEFDATMQRQREQSRKNWTGTGDMEHDQFWYDMHDLHGPSEFLGYETERARGRILALEADGV